MIHGYPLVRQLAAELQDFMRGHGFSSVEQFRGAALPYFTTHTDLVVKQKAALAAKKATRKGLVDSDAAWTGEGFVDESESMASN